MIKDEIEEPTISQDTLCGCVYKTLLREDNDCMIEIDGIHYSSNDLEYAKEISDIAYEEFEDDICEVFERICLLTNEEIPLGNVTYIRVHRIIFSPSHIFDLNMFRDLTNITVWSNGHTNPHYSDYAIYWKGKLLNRCKCPPTVSCILDYMDVYYKQLMFDIDNNIISENSLLRYKEFIELYEALHDETNADNDSNFYYRVQNCQKDRW